MSNSIDFYERIFLHFVPACIIVPRSNVRFLHMYGCYHSDLEKIRAYTYRQSLAKIILWEQSYYVSIRFNFCCWECQYSEKPSLDIIIIIIIIIIIMYFHKENRAYPYIQLWLFIPLTCSFHETYHLNSLDEM